MERKVRIGGRIRCDIICAENIPVKFMGAYVNARIRHNGIPDKSTKQRTRVIKNTSDPVWNEELTFRIRNVYTDSISFHIYDKGAVQANILIGACAVNLIDEFPPPYDTECVFKDFVLDFVKGEALNGKLHVKIYYYPETVSIDDLRRETLPELSYSANPRDSLDPSDDFDDDEGHDHFDVHVNMSSNASAVPASPPPTSEIRTRRDIGGRTLSKASSLNAYIEKLRQDDPQKLAGTKKLKNPRELVSLQKKRFQDDRWNLDLAYITDRIIAMGFPSSGMEKYYRNSMEDTQAFLNHYHPNCHKVYNLCSERDYPPDKFYRQGVYPFDDHNVPTIEMIAAFCQDLNEWMDENEHNVAAIHCKAGKGRTGLMITAFLPFRYEDKIDVETSLQFYAERRTMNCKGVTIPSQVRFVRYFASIIPQVKAGLFDLDRPRIITKITIDFPPNNLVSNFVIINKDSKFVSKESIPVMKYKDAVNLTFSIPHMEVNREVKVSFFDEKEKGASFYFWYHESYSRFHTYWIKGDQFALRANEIDKPKPKGGYDPKFNITVHFAPEPQRSPIKRSASEKQSETDKTLKRNSDKKVEASSSGDKALGSSSSGIDAVRKKKPLPPRPLQKSRSVGEDSNNAAVMAPSSEVKVNSEGVPIPRSQVPAKRKALDKDTFTPPSSTSSYISPLSDDG